MMEKNLTSLFSSIPSLSANTIPGLKFSRPSQSLPSRASLAAMAAKNATAATSVKVPPAVKAAIAVNKNIIKYEYAVWFSIMAALILYTIAKFGFRYFRTVACLNRKSLGSQEFFRRRNRIWGRFRRYFIDAPLIRTRHHREFRLSRAINMGTLPSRFQSTFLFLYFASQVTFILYRLDYSNTWEVILSNLNTRTGVLAVMNMLPLVIFAGRNNPLIPLCGISFDTFNLLHRWVGRVAICQALIHFIAWAVKRAKLDGLEAIQGALTKSAFIISGMIGLCAFLFILLASPSPIRHAFYETFLTFHILAVALSIGALFYHTRLYTYMHHVLIGAMSLWILDRVLRLVRIFYRNFGKSGSLAVVEVLPGNAVRLTVSLPKSWFFRTGQHAYVYIPSVELFTSHPFSVAWWESESIPSTGNGSVMGMVDGVAAPSTAVKSSKEEGLPSSGGGGGLQMTRVNMEKERHQRQTMSFIIARETGFTDKLYRKAVSAGGKFSPRVYVEGPYGSQDLNSFGTVVLFAAGVGITHHLPHVRDIVQRYSRQLTAVRQLTLIWIIREPERLEWIQSWMTKILAIPNRREVLQVQLYVTHVLPSTAETSQPPPACVLDNSTGDPLSLNQLQPLQSPPVPTGPREIHSSSSSIHMFTGRPNVESIIEERCDQAIGSTAVVCCGVGSLADDLRKACRRHMTYQNVTFMEESFTW